MKRLMIILAISLSILMSSTLTQAADAPKVLLILPNPMPEYIDTVLSKEVSVMKSLLQNAGFKVVAASTDGMTIKGSTETFTPDLKLSDVKADDYIGVIIACMGSGEYTPVSPIAISIVKQAITQGKPVAASHSSVNVLAEAGVLANKRYAFRVDPLGIGGVRMTDSLGQSMVARGLYKMEILSLVVFALRVQQVMASMTAPPSSPRPS